MVGMSAARNPEIVGQAIHIFGHTGGVTELPPTPGILDWDFPRGVASAALMVKCAAEHGVSRDDMIEEARRFGPPVIDVLVANGMFDEIVRSTHADFFASPQVAAILAD